MKNPAFKDLWQKPKLFLALGLGSGLAPKAPGTFGSIAALILVPFLLLVPIWFYALFLIVSIIFGIWLCDEVAKLLQTSDPACIVWDEFVGIWLTFFFVSIHQLEHYWLWLLVGFGLFRIFDIFKPFPVSYFDQNIKGGLGIMLDDIAAGVLACFCLHLLIWLF